MNMPVITLENCENIDLSDIVDPALKSRVNAVIRRSMDEVRRWEAAMDSEPRMIAIEIKRKHIPLSNLTMEVVVADMVYL